MKNVDKARYFIKKAAVHNYLRSMLRNIKLEKIAQASTVSGYISPEEYQSLSTDGFNGNSASDLNSYKIQRMRRMRDSVKAKQPQNQPQPQPIQDQPSKPVPLPDPSNGRYAKIQAPEPVPIPLVPYDWPRQQANPSQSRTGSSPNKGRIVRGNQVGTAQIPSKGRIVRGNQGGTAPFTPNRGRIVRGNQGGTSWR